MKSDQEKPEMEFAERFVVHPSGNFRVPVIKCAEKRMHNSANDHVVKMCDDEIRAVKLPVERRNGQHDAGKPSNQKLEQEADAEQHRRFELNPPAPHGAKPVKDFDSGRYAYNH